MTIDLSRILRQLPALPIPHLLALQSALTIEFERRSIDEYSGKPERLYTQAEMDERDRLIRDLIQTHNEQVAIIRGQDRVRHWQQLVDETFKNEQANRGKAIIVNDGRIDATGYKP